MILNIILFKNVKIDCFTQPQFTDIVPETAAIELARSLKLNEGKDEIKKFKNLKMYTFGTFDDSTGNFVLLEEPKELLDCTKFFKKGAVVNG